MFKFNIKKEVIYKFKKRYINEFDHHLESLKLHYVNLYSLNIVISLKIQKVINPVLNLIHQLNCH